MIFLWSHGNIWEGIVLFSLSSPVTSLLVFVEKLCRAWTLGTRRDLRMRRARGTSCTAVDWLLHGGLCLTKYFISLRTSLMQFKIVLNSLSHSQGSLNSSFSCLYFLSAGITSRPCLCGTLGKHTSHARRACSQFSCIPSFEDVGFIIKTLGKAHVKSWSPMYTDIHTSHGI